MANEIDLYKDLEYCDKALKVKSLDDVSKKEWRKERKRIVNEIKEKYPDLAWRLNKKNK